jgi:hypothetical protein
MSFNCDQKVQTSCYAQYYLRKKSAVKLQGKRKYILLVRGLVLVIEIRWSSSGASQSFIEGEWKKASETVVYPTNFADIGGYEE